MAWKASSGDVGFELLDGVGVLRIGRSAKLGALTLPMIEDLVEGVRSISEDSAVRGVVLTGTGRAFSAGGDLPSMATGSSEYWELFKQRFNDLTIAILSARVPVIAALNGLAVGGAAEFVLSADARLGSSQAGYFFPDNGMGLTLSNGASYLLVRMMGSRALPMILSSARIEASQALACGLLDEIVDGDVVLAAIELIRSWTVPSSATASHLKLLRPSIEEVRRAMASEGRIASAKGNANGIADLLAARERR